uniref:Uncharacterized protein n=1 Tax=Panagrolaimus davidi TaxID=227884 RepID=A0A914PDT8_9BILA
MNYLLQVFLSFILFNFVIQTLCYVETEEDYITISSKSEDISVAKDPRYILYEINYGEGFNSRRDVYMRIAQTVQTLRKKVNWGVLITKHGKMVFNTNEIVPKTVVVSRSHAGKVQELVNTALKGQYTVEPFGGSVYKTLGLINSTAGKILYSFLKGP